MSLGRRSQLGDCKVGILLDRMFFEHLHPYHDFSWREVIRTSTDGAKTEPYNFDHAQGEGTSDTSYWLKTILFTRLSTIVGIALRKSIRS